MKKKLIAALTSAAMVATMVPATAFAAADSGTPKSEAPTAVVAAENESEAVTAFKEAVKKIPAKDSRDYTAAYKATLDAATDAYEALKAGDKDSVEETTEKATYDAALAEYKGWEEAVNKLIDMIDKLPNKLGAVTKGDVTSWQEAYNGVGAPVITAAKAYQALEKDGQKKSITNIAKLHALADNDGDAIADNAGAMVLYEALRALNNVETIDGTNYENNPDLNTAKEAIDALDSTQMNMIAQDLMGKYQKAEQTADKATKLMTAYQEAYNTLAKDYNSTDNVTADNMADADALCKATEDAYAALSAVEGLQAKAKNPKHMKNIRGKIAKLQDAETANKEAQPVLDRIAALPKASDVKDMSLYDEVNAIYEAYSNLTAKAQDVVKDSTRAAEFDGVVRSLVDAYNNMTAEEQAARAKAALAQLPSDDYEINQRAQTEYMMATTSAETQARINAKSVAYNGNAKPAKKVFHPE